MDQVTDIAKKTGMALVAAASWLAHALWAISRATGRILWGTAKWTARVGLWLVCWPLGLWRSIRHGRKKNNAKVLAEVKKFRNAA